MDIDWSGFDDLGHDTLTCKCGARFRGHAKVVKVGEHHQLYSRDPCPGCGENDQIRGIRTDPEPMSIG